MKIITPFLIVCLFFAQLRAQTVTFNYTGAVQTYTVPPCVSSITVDMMGAAGGNGVDPSSVVMSNGGLGGRLQATFPVSPGDILNIYVGGVGSIGIAGGGPGGFNGGGRGGDGFGYRGGGGGGASDIRLNGT